MARIVICTIVTRLALVVYSSPNAFAQTGCGLPEAPTRLTADTPPGAVTLTWAAPSTGCAPSSYVIEAGSAPGLSNLARLSTGNVATSFTATAIPSGVYYVRVAAQTTAGTGPASNEAVITVGTRACSGPPDPPSGLTATVSGTTVALTWNGVPEATSYVLEVGLAFGRSDLLIRDIGPVTSLSSGAVAGTYYVRVRGRNSCGTGGASNEASVRVDGGVVPLPNGPIFLTGNQSMIIDRDVVFKNDIILRDNAVLTIRHATFTHVIDYPQQYQLRASGHSKVILENVNLRTTSPWLSWTFEDDASLRETNVTNPAPTMWISLRDGAQAVAASVTSFHGTAHANAAITVDGAEDTFIETVFPFGTATVTESYPATIGAVPYAFPNSGESGSFPRLMLRDVRNTEWGISYYPGNRVTISDTQGLAVTFATFADDNQQFTGAVQFSNLRAQLYPDAAWTTAGSVLRLINTRTRNWSPNVSGNNHSSLLISNSDLADFVFLFGNTDVTIVDSTIETVRATTNLHFTIANCIIALDVVAEDNSVVELVNTTVRGRIVTNGNGRVIVR